MPPENTPAQAAAYRLRDALRAERDAAAHLDGTDGPDVIEARANDYIAARLSLKDAADAYASEAMTGGPPEVKSVGR